MKLYMAKGPWGPYKASLKGHIKQGLKAFLGCVALGPGSRRSLRASRLHGCSHIDQFFYCIKPVFPNVLTAVLLHHSQV